MANLPAVLFRGILPDTEHPVTVTVPVGKRWILTNLVLTSTVSTSVVPVAASISVDGVALLVGVCLDPGDVLTLDCAQVIDAGKTVTLHASVAASIATHVSGVECDV